MLHAEHGFGVKVGLALAMSMPLLALAQEPPSFGDVQKANAATLREYTWTSRTEIKVKGESKNIKLEQVRYDLDGALQKTSVGGAPVAPPAADAAGGRGLRGRAKQRVIENKKEDFAELMASLAQLVASYGHLQPAQIDAFVKGATTTKGQGVMEGALGIRGESVLHAADALTIWVDPATMLMRRVEIASSLEQKPVSAVAEYQAVSGGPSYMARAVLKYPDKGVELIVENYDYQRVGR